MTVQLSPTNQLHRQERTAGRTRWVRWVQIDFAETANGDLDVFANDVVEGILTEVITAFNSTTSDVLDIGDGDVADGYDADVDLQVEADATTPMIPGNGAIAAGKRYAADDKILLAVTSVDGPPDEGVVRVHVFGFHDPD